MNNEKLITFCDKGMAFSFFALIYFLPISVALSEFFTAVALVLYLVKRSALFYRDTRAASPQEKNIPWWKKGYHFLKAFKPVGNCLNWPIAALLLYSFGSVFFSQYRDLSFEAFMGKTLQSAFLYFNFIECMNSRKRLKIFLTVLLVSSLLICTNGFYQYFVGRGFIFGQAYEGRMASSLRQANDFAAYLLVVIPLLVCLLTIGFRFKKDAPIPPGVRSFTGYFHKLSVPVLIGLIGAMICLGLTYSRGAWVAFVLALAVLGLTNRKVFLPFLAVIILFSVTFFPRLTGKRNPIYDEWTFKVENNRLGYWERSLDIIKDYPLFGSGLNTYSLVSQRYANGWGGYPHNSYLQMVCELGIVGFAVFSWMLMALFKCSLGALRRIKIQSQKTLLIGCLTGLLAFLIHSFFDTSFYSVQLGSLLWVEVGLIVAVQKVEASPDVP